MNLVEAYTKYNKQLIILISGLSGCGKSKLAENISRDLKLTHLEQHTFYKPNYNNLVNLPNSTKINNIFTDDSLDWDKFNSEVNKHKLSGVIISGFAFPQDKLKFTSDYHISLAIKKDLCISKRAEYIKKHKNKYKQEYKDLENNTDRLIMNMLIFPYFLESNKKSKINKYITYTDNKQVSNDVWTDLFTNFFTQESIEKLYLDYTKNNKNNNNIKNNKNNNNKIKKTRKLENKEETSDDSSQDDSSNNTQDTSQEETLNNNQEEITKNIQEEDTSQNILETTTSED